MLTLPGLFFKMYLKIGKQKNVSKDYNAQSLCFWSYEKTHETPLSVMEKLYPINLHIMSLKVLIF